MNKKTLLGIILLVIAAGLLVGLYFYIESTKSQKSQPAENSNQSAQVVNVNSDEDWIQRQEQDISGEQTENQPSAIQKTELKTSLPVGAYLKNGELWYSDLENDIDQRWGDDSGINKIFGFSFDQKKVLYGKFNEASKSDVVARYNLYLYNRESSQVETIATDIDLTSTQWSKIDNKIFYYDFASHLGLIDYDNNKAQSILVPEGDYYRDFVLSLDGQYIAYSKLTGGDPVMLDTYVYLLDLRTKLETQVTAEEYGAYPLTFSSDSQKLYYTTDKPLTDERHRSIWVYNLETKESQHLIPASMTGYYDRLWEVANDQVLVAEMYQQSPLESQLYLVKNDGSSVSKYPLTGEVLGVFPDQQRILITTLDTGTIVADLDGDNLGNLPDKYLDEYLQVQYVWE